MKQITAIYFSPTKNTEKSIKAMMSAAGCPHEIIDVTTNPNPAAQTFTPDDFVIFGAPVYGGRIPAVARNRLTAFSGNHTPCIIVVTYGNRDYDDALLELSELAQAQGFIVQGGAALIGRHTYGEIQTDRPNAEDLAADTQFAEKIFSGEMRTSSYPLPGNHPYKDGGNGGKFRPLTADSCVTCGLCVKSCPVGAIGSDCKTIADNCLSCFRCIRICPVGAKNCNTEEYCSFAKSFTERLKERRENQYFPSL
jgi:ferredoxin